MPGAGILMAGDGKFYLILSQPGMAEGCSEPPEISGGSFFLNTVLRKRPDFQGVSDLFFTLAFC